MRTSVQVIAEINELLDGLDWETWNWKDELDFYLGWADRDSWLFVCDEDYYDILNKYISDELDLTIRDENGAYGDWQLQRNVTAAAKDFENAVIRKCKSTFEMSETQRGLSIPGFPLDEVEMAAFWVADDGSSRLTNVGWIEYRVYQPDRENYKQYGGEVIVSSYLSEDGIRAELKRRLADHVEELTRDTDAVVEEYYGEY